MIYPRLGFLEMIYVLLLIISTVYKRISLELENNVVYANNIIICVGDNNKV